jgi:uncharacterized coiled-coil DUF342 family protein
MTTSEELELILNKIDELRQQILDLGTSDEVGQAEIESLQNRLVELYKEIDSFQPGKVDNSISGHKDLSVIHSTTDKNSESSNSQNGNAFNQLTVWGYAFVTGI